MSVIKEYVVQGDVTFTDDEAATARRAVHRFAAGDPAIAAELEAMLGIDGNTEPLRSSANLKRRRTTHPEPGTPLTPAERETLRFYQQEGTCLGASREMGINDRTIATRLQRIRHKAGVARNTDLLELDMEAVA